MLLFRSLPVMFVQCDQTAEDFVTISFEFDSLMSLSDCFKI